MAGMGYGAGARGPIIVGWVSEKSVRSSVMGVEGSWRLRG